jgi:hypothetical protein
MQRLVFFIFLLGSSVVLALHTAAGAQRRPTLPLLTACMSNAATVCEQDQPITNAILICLITERSESGGCDDAAFVVEISQRSEAQPKMAIRPSVN